MRIKTGKIWSIMRKGLRMGGILLMVLAVMLSVNMITVQAQGIHVAEDIDDNAIEREAAKEAEEIKEILKSGAGSGSTSESGDAALGTETAAPVTPLGEELQGMADGTVDVNNVLLKSKMMQLAAEATDNTLNIGDGDIVLKEGGAYTQTTETTVVYEGTAAEQKFTIWGLTDKYNITVEAGARPEITLDKLSSNLSGSSLGKSSIYIKSGAIVTLVLPSDGGGTGTVLTGSQFMPGIILEDGATLKIEGDGSIRVYGEGSKYAIESNQDSAGGSLLIEGNVDFQAYSKRTDGAIRVKPSSIATMKRILQGTLASVQNSDTTIQAENRDARSEKYSMKLPKDYLSFATATTAAGGDYVSYIPDTAGTEVKDSMLLANVSNKALHSYNLTGAGNTMASLSGLISQKITYTVTFDANGGLLNGQPKILQGDVGYGTVLTKPSPNPGRNNHDFAEWHKVKDSLALENQWEFGSGGDSVVRDTLIYASWKPIQCTVIYYSDNKKLKTDDTKTFGDIIQTDEKPDPKKDGFALVGWLTEDGSEWKFGSDGTTITKETTVLRAKWLADCKVTFNANAGSDEVTNMPAPNPLTVSATTTIPISPEDKPQREGYKFVAWYTDAKCTKIWNLGVDTVTKSMTLYAGWGADETNVTFHVNSQAGESVNPPTAKVEFGKEIPVPNAEKPARTTLATTYTVEGWYTDEKLTSKWDFDEGLKDADGKFDLYAKWRQVTCYAIFQANHPDAIPQEDQNLSATYNESLENAHMDLDDKLAGMFKRTGYEVKSWTTSTGKAWDMSTPLTGDVVLKAQWTPEVYTINFEAPNEEGCPPVPSGEGAKQITYGKTLSRPNYPGSGQKWLGHTFQGWYTEEDGGGHQWKFSDEPGADKVEGPMTLYAYWTLDEYTVSFQTYQGDENPPEAETGLHYGDPIPEPSEPSRDRYEFLGWMTEDERLWDFSSDTVTGDMSLYAEWQGEPVDVILNVKYEPENEDPGKVLQVTLEDVRYGDFLTREQVEDQNTPETKKRPGYTLNGWYTGDGYQDEQLWNFAENQVLPEGNELMLYAHWTWDEYTVQFVTYKGDSSVPSQSGLRYGNLVTRPVPDPSRAHYTLDAWYTAPDIADETTAWDFAKSTVTGDMSLYASWIPDVYTLSFETNGGSGLEPVEVTYGTYVPADNLKTTRAGYVLTGWYRDAELTQPFLPASEYVDKTMTIYAKWELQKYTVRYHYRASEDSDEEEVVTYKEAYKVGDYLPNPNKKVPHKTLSSWYKDDAYQDKWVFKRDKVQGDTDLYAYWSDTEYTVHFETYDGTEIKDIKMLWGDQPEQPKDPVRTGYTFTGWFKDADGKDPWSFEEDFVEGDTTIYSGWEANLYTVSFDTAGGSEAPESQTVAYDSLIAEPAAPTRDGYVFDGWGADGKIWDFKKDTLKGDLTLTAQWSEPENPGGNAGGNQGGGGQSGSGNGNVGTASTGTGTQNSGTGTDTANQALKDASNAIKEILTGDKAPLTYSIAGIILAAAGIIGALYKKIK